MSQIKRFLDVLVTTGTVCFDQNSSHVQALTEQASKFITAELSGESGCSTVWHLPLDSPFRGPRIQLLPSGHLVFYGTHGRRILNTDPEGTTLHECEWHGTEDGGIQMTHARLQLDCQQWVGIRPEATEQVTTLELPPSLRGQQLTAETFRQAAAQAWGCPLDDLRYFFPDENFTQDEANDIKVRLKKDGVYLLQDGTFDQTQFVSYMGAIPWARIDLLNVVELYQSTLPGTGGAVFDLIWGLCDDQRLAEGSIPLRYRGLPTFPSEQAYGLFCAFFRPETAHGEDPYKLFMDTQRAYEIAWWPRPDPPWRYFDKARQLCLTIQGGVPQKVTVMDDPVAVPYVRLGMKGFASCGRTVDVIDNTLQLRDGQHTTEISLNSVWGLTKEQSSSNQLPTYPFEWRALFRGDPPTIDPVRAWRTVLLFPEDASEVGEESTQLFVLEQIYDYLNQLSDLRSRLERTYWVLIHNFDPICAGLTDPDNQRRRYTILYRHQGWAQKNAQIIWDRTAREVHLGAVPHVEFVPEQAMEDITYQGNYDLIYRWIPFNQYDDPPACEAVVKRVAHATSAGGFACVVGPPDLVDWFPKYGLNPLGHGGVDALVRLPAVIEHFRIHPKTHVNPQLTVVMGEKGA
ncbi:MAG: hypothetical protein OEM58_07645 [Nitrospirota bacterium]|nr:hypothetical protein [Nitrospirota bacterium]